MDFFKKYKITDKELQTNHASIVKDLKKQDLSSYKHIYVLDNLKDQNLSFDFSKINNNSLVIFNNLKNINIIEKSNYFNISKLNIILLFNNSKQVNYIKSLSSSNYLENNVNLFLLKSNINFTNLFFNLDNVKYNQNNLIKSKNSKYYQNDLVFLNNSQKNTINIQTLHLSKNTFSNTTSRNILKNNSFLRYDGLIDIKKGAQQTNAFLQSNTMLLSKSSMAINIPKLEIIPNNVKASHSATNEYISNEKLFYLESRGLSKRISKRMLISSFLKSFITFYPEYIVEYISKKINDKL